MDFPHLTDTRFPYLANENVYAFQNTFDYTRWTENSKVRLVNVPWNSTYSDVVLFDTDEIRDAWFDSLESCYPVNMETAARIVPDGYIKLPVPYDVAARYNYVYVDIPIATSEAQMIEYETGTGIRRWYFFIDSIDYGSQNSTHLYIRQDVWTNFQNHVDFRYMLLERGHAPVAASDTDEYLANPIVNNGLLLAPDVDFGRGTVVRDSNLIQFGNGTKYVVFATSATRKNMLEMGSRTGDGTGVWTDPTYSDANGRDGHQLIVNGYQWGDGYDYSGLRTRSDNGASNGNRIANNTTCWAIPANKCFGFTGSSYGDSFLVKISHECPSFLQSILAMFVVDESMISLSSTTTVEICGETLSYCNGKESAAQNLRLSRSDFAYPERYERFAKLYTFPYASLELTDNEGSTVNVRIEDTGKMTYKTLTSVAFPYLDMRVLFNGIGGSGSKSYTWKDLIGSERRINIGTDDWGAVMFDWSIPTFSLMMDGETAYNLHSQSDLRNARIDALTGYHTSMREANCAYNNSLALAATSETNVDANADTLVANNANTCNAQTANTAQTVATNSANVALANTASTTMKNAQNVVNNTKLLVNNTLMVASTQANNEVSIATAKTSGRAAITTGAINGMSATGMAMAAGPEMAPAVIAGGIVGALGGLVNAEAGMDNALVLTQAKSSITADTVSANSSNNTAQNGLNDVNTQTMNDLHTDQTTNTNNCITAQTANNVAAATANAANTSTTMKGNAARTRSTSDSNSGYTHSAAESNAKEILEAAQDKARNRYISASNATPQQIGLTSGNPEADYFMTRGVQVKVRTESDSAIRQAGDHFARFGYALNQMWDVEESGLCPMRHFCYWKASEIWVDDACSSNNEVNTTMRRIFLDGVTVWKDAHELGRVSVYDN